MRGRRLAIFLAFILTTLFVCKTYLPSERATMATADETVSTY